MNHAVHSQFGTVLFFAMSELELSIDKRQY